MEESQTQTLLPSGIRLMIFEYFSTKQLLTQISLLSKQTKDHLLASKIKRNTTLKIPNHKDKTKSLLNIIKLSNKVTIDINDNTNLFNLFYLLTLMPESLKKDRISLSVSSYTKEFVTVLENFRDFIFDGVTIQQVDSQKLGVLQMTCNQLILNYGDLQMSQLSEIDQRNKLKVLRMYECTLKSNNNETYEFERITNLQIELTKIKVDLSKHFDFSILETFVYENNTEYSLNMLTNNLSRLKKVNLLYLDLQLQDNINYQQVLRSLADGEKSINQLRFREEMISIKLSEILQEYPIRLIKEGQFILKAITIDNLYVRDKKFKGKIIKGYQDLNIKSMNYFVYSFTSKNINTLNISIKIKDEQTGNLLKISSLTGNIVKIHSEQS